jgi:hypothetical protein
LRLTVLFLCATLFTALGCSSTTEPVVEVVLTMQNISGIYTGVTFTTESNGVLTKQLLIGGSIQLLLHGDGTTGGTLVMAADTAGGVGLNESLAGSWTLDGDIVTLSHNSDTFLEDMALVFEETHLTGETTRGGVIYRVVLAW